jgi:hypothetical protein
MACSFNWCTLGMLTRRSLAMVAKLSPSQNRRSMISRSRSGKRATRSRRSCSGLWLGLHLRRRFVLASPACCQLLRLEEVRLTRRFAARRSTPAARSLSGRSRPAGARTVLWGRRNAPQKVDRPPIAAAHATIRSSSTHSARVPTGWEWETGKELPQSLRKPPLYRFGSAGSDGRFVMATPTKVSAAP